MLFVIICWACAMLGFLIGLLLAGRIAEHKIAEMRLEAGLDIQPTKEDESDPLKDWEKLFEE